MITPVELVNGLQGAIGSAYRALSDQLFFVEFGGRISRLDLTPSGATTAVSSNNTTLRGTFRFDFDAGIHSGEGTGATWDVWWQQVTSTERNLRARNGAAFAYLGQINYNSLSAAELHALEFNTDTIVGNDDASNQLVPNAVFAVRSRTGKIAKVQVISYGYDLVVRFRTYDYPNPYQIIGTGYTDPEDIVLSIDGQHAYVTERNGHLLRVDLSNANRAAATVVAAGMTAPHQISLDEAHGHAYVVEFATSGGRLLRIDLDTGAQNPVATGLERAIGLLVTADQQFAYITEQAAAGGRLLRIELASGRREEIVSGMDQPFFLSWADPGEGGILTTERDPANRVSYIDLTESVPTVQHLATGVASRPSSVAVRTEQQLLVCSDGSISRLDLTASIYSAVGPMFLGVGHVPVDRIVGGYADTTVDPTYFFQVKDAPFGGTLALMVNHTRAYQDGGRYYRIEVEGVSQKDSWTDYRWSTSANRFVAIQQNALGGPGYFRVRRPNELWYNHWLGYRLNTQGLPNGLHTVTVRIYNAANLGTEIAHHSVQLMIDNQWPVASIDEIIHHHISDGEVVVGTCGIVTENSDQFSFTLTARDTENHLKSWRLSALWGDNKSAGIDAGSYPAPAIDPTWALNGTRVPSSPWSATVPGDPTSRRCAHTFYLTVWDRVINGYHYIHRSSFHKSVTLLLP